MAEGICNSETMCVVGAFRWAVRSACCCEAWGVEEGCVAHSKRLWLLLERLRFDEELMSADEIERLMAVPHVVGVVWHG